MLSDLERIYADIFRAIYIVIYSCLITSVIKNVFLSFSFHLDSVSGYFSSKWCCNNYPRRVTIRLERRKKKIFIEEKLPLMVASSIS